VIQDERKVKGRKEKGRRKQGRGVMKDGDKG
jgi:hypothetical protein